MRLSQQTTKRKTAAPALADVSKMRLRPMSARGYAGTQGATLPTGNERKPVFVEPVSGYTVDAPSQQELISEAMLRLAQQAPSPYAPDIAKAQADVARSSLMREGLQTMPVRRLEAPTITPPPMPQREQVAVPEREPAQVTDTMAGLAALASLFAPTQGGNIVSAMYQGANRAADRTFADDVYRYSQNQGQANQRFEDALQGRGERLRLQENQANSQLRLDQDALRQEQSIADALLRYAAEQQGGQTLSDGLLALAQQQRGADVGQTEIGNLLRELQAEQDAAAQGMANRDAELNFQLKSEELQSRQEDRKARQADRDADRQLREALGWGGLAARSLRGAGGTDGLTTSQALNAQMRAAGLGLTLPPGVIPQGMAIPGIGDAAGGNASMRASRAAMDMANRDFSVQVARTRWQDAERNYGIAQREVMQGLWNDRNGNLREEGKRMLAQTKADRDALAAEYQRTVNDAIAHYNGGGARLSAPGRFTEPKSGGLMTDPGQMFNPVPGSSLMGGGAASAAPRTPPKLKLTTPRSPAQSPATSERGAKAIQAVPLTPKSVSQLSDKEMLRQMVERLKQAGGGRR